MGGRVAPTRAGATRSRLGRSLDRRAVVMAEQPRSRGAVSESDHRRFQRARGTGVAERFEHELAADLGCADNEPSMTGRSQVGTLSAPWSTPTWLSTSVTF